LRSKLAEADAALSKAEKICDDFSRLPSVSEEDAEDWAIKLSLAMGRYILFSNMKKYTNSIIQKILHL